MAYNPNFKPREEKPDFMEGFKISHESLKNVLSMENRERYSSHLCINNSALRNVYDSYLDIYNSSLSENEKKIKIQIWIAKTAYQERRTAQGGTILPKGFSKFLNNTFTSLNENLEEYKDLLEVLVAYNKYYNPKK